MADETTSTSKATTSQQAAKERDQQPVEFEEITIRVRKDMDAGLRDSLIRSLTRTGAAPVVGNLADLQRLGAAQVAGESKPLATAVQTHPDVSDDEAKEGAKRTLEEEAEAKAGPPDPGPGAEEPLSEKDPNVIVDAKQRAEVQKEALKG